VECFGVFGTLSALFGGTESLWEEFAFVLDKLVDFAATAVAGVGGYGTGWFDVWM